MTEKREPTDTEMWDFAEHCSFHKRSQSGIQSDGQEGCADWWEVEDPDGQLHVGNTLREAIRAAMEADK